ncbi:enoyl-CoA hydratase/isomerase family protein [Streptomyces coelicolor]|uniref:DpgB n=1 Tax=Streptomyces toyocaensis TaxID=55952 RepID=Q8KLK6_STRTO|nr:MULTISPECIES: enoyl-CoA-hydratase DpgB [Streptomyces]AAM80547.1 DpgB [Streptomyces toyocaensis]KES08699.1 enoyl-CoA hydratase [Streptomyces toyocaensis]NSL78873.1 enoyl-CoA hydratase/isomerase family protein [Streptomyces coelicolor]QKN71287.1 enoyl-CoA hydratase/isomerase family protein [Streptomyces coelicolor]
MEDALTLTIDGTEPLSAASVKAVAAVCDRAEDLARDDRGAGVVTVHVSGAPEGAWTSGLDVMLVTKWERVLRRLERLPMATVAVASGDCGGPALDVLLTTDIRVATPDTRMSVPRDGSATWPGMAAYRLVQQAGVGRIRRAVLFGLPIGAADAVRLGIVDELADDPAAAVAAAAELVAGLAGKEVAIRRQLLFDATTTSFEDVLGPHLAACDRALRGKDVAEESV